MSKKADSADSLSGIKEYWDKRAKCGKNDNDRVEQNRRPQLMRYETFLHGHDLTGKSILDIGCGTGELLAHLYRRGIRCRYKGVDLSGEMIQLCRQKFPESEFEETDVLVDDLSEQFDYTISVGIHNVKFSGNREILEKMTRRQFELCRVAAHVSILTNRYDGFADHIQAWCAEDVLKLALSITPYAVLRHDYLPNDFSVTLYREPLIDTCKDLLLD